jgi:hypothetical protein
LYEIQARLVITNIGNSCCVGYILDIQNLYASRISLKLYAVILIENVFVDMWESDEDSSFLIPILQRGVHNFRDWRYRQVLTLGLLATIALEVVSFHTYIPFPALLPFF